MQAAIFLPKAEASLPARWRVSSGENYDVLGLDCQDAALNLYFETPEQVDGAFQALIELRRALERRLKTDAAQA